MNYPYKFLSRFFLISFLLCTMLIAVSETHAGSKVRVLSAVVEGGISPAQVNLLEDIIGQADDDDYDFILLRLDTPGGLGSSMRDMVKLIMNSGIPVCIWVGPEGAHAASAGAFLVAAAQVSAMAPGTTIGAASPVSSSGDDLPDTMSKKVKNDMTSLIKGIARKRGRNINWYAKAVEDGVSIDAQDAVALNVVNMLAVSVEDYLEQLGAKGIELSGKETKFSEEDIEITEFEPGFRYSILTWLLDPQVAYFLLIGGILGIFFELSHPGTMLPGVVGGFCFLTALYALSILPTNAAGLLLIIFACVLFILEIFIISYGLLSIAAIISLFVGSLVLFRGGEVQQIPLGTIVSTVLSFAVLAIGLIYLVSKAQVRKTDMGIQAMVGMAGEVINTENRRMKIRIRGEIWNAVADDNAIFEQGTKVEVVQVDGLTLKIVKMS